MAMILDGEYGMSPIALDAKHDKDPRVDKISSEFLCSLAFQSTKGTY
jgi:hypothetical protein